MYRLEVSFRKFDRMYLVWAWVEDYAYASVRKEMIERGLGVPKHWIITGVYKNEQQALKRMQELRRM